MWCVGQTSQIFYQFLSIENKRNGEKNQCPNQIGQAVWWENSKTKLNYENRMRKTILYPEHFDKIESPNTMNIIIKFKLYYELITNIPMSQWIFCITGDIHNVFCQPLGIYISLNVVSFFFRIKRRRSLYIIVHIGRHKNEPIFQVRKHKPWSMLCNWWDVPATKSTCFSKCVKRKSTARNMYQI